MEDCIFCKIVAGDIPSHKVYEDNTAYAFLDIQPSNIGHTLVIPKEHSRNALAMSDDNFAMLMRIVHHVAHAVKKGVGAEGVNIILNNENVAGQKVFHTHAHIVPRFANDGHEWWVHKHFSEDETKKATEKITSLL